MPKNDVPHSNASTKPSSAPTKTSREGRYNRMCVDDLQRLVKVRGIRLRDVLINVLAEQDRYHADHPFPFLRLPAELRNQVYSYILVPSRMAYNSLEIPLLARVSSQIRRESLDVFFGCNTLSLTTASIDLEQLQRQALTQDSIQLLDRIAPHADHVRKVAMNITIKLKRARKCSIKLTLERCIDRTPQYIASTTLNSDSRYTKRSPMKHIMERIKDSIQRSAQAHLDRSRSFLFSANDIDFLLDSIPAFLKVVIDEKTRSVTLSKVERPDMASLEQCNCRRRDMHGMQCTEEWIRGLQG